MARTEEKYKDVMWRSFRIPREAWTWLGIFRSNYGMDFQSCLALALEIGADKEMPEGIYRTVDVEWQTACVQDGMHERMKAMALDMSAKLQDIGAAMLESARLVMEDKAQLREFINERTWPEGYKLTAQVANLAEQLGRLTDWETQGVE